MPTLRTRRTRGKRILSGAILAVITLLAVTWFVQSRDIQAKKSLAVTKRFFAAVEANDYALANQELCVFEKDQSAQERETATHRFLRKYNIDFAIESYTARHAYKTSGGGWFTRTSKRPEKVTTDVSLVFTDDQVLDPNVPRGLPVFLAFVNGRTCIDRLAPTELLTS